MSRTRLVDPIHVFTSLLASCRMLGVALELSARHPLSKREELTLVDKAPSGPQWMHEIKLDGYRMGCVLRGGRVRLISRRDQDWTSSFPTVVAATKQLDVSEAVLDGEVVVVTKDGCTSFQALQNARWHAAAVTYFAFDLLYVDGRDLRAMPLEERKTELLALVKDTKIRFSQHFEGDGELVRQHACKLGAEGIVSKLRDAPYRATRSSAWLKTKCVQRQEFVIGGFTDPEGTRQGIGSMLLGYYEGDALRFAGKVGTGKGFTAAYTSELRRRFEPIEQKACPFVPRPPGWLGKHAHWVRPELVAEVQFGEWTAGNHVRHPSFLGFRSDKSPAAITREAPVRATTLPSARTKSPSATKRASKQRRPTKRR